MQNAIEGKVEFYRRDGKWHVSINGPFWVMCDLAQELHKAGDVLSLVGGPAYGIPEPVTTSMLFRAGEYALKEQEQMTIVSDQPEAEHWHSLAVSLNQLLERASEFLAPLESTAWCSKESLSQWRRDYKTFLEEIKR